MLDCSTCPTLLRPDFDTPTLLGKILLRGYGEEVGVCGNNRLGRTLGNTGLVGLGYASTTSERIRLPGHTLKSYRLGEHRDAKPRDGDDGIPFPQFDVAQYSFAQFLLKSGFNEGAEIRARLTPTAPNPWRSTFCDYWKPLATLLIMGHIGVAERAISNWLGHIRSTGLRLDLAQLALATEMVAHTLMALMHHDPFGTFQWAVLPDGAFAAFIFGSIVLTCSSTLLLAAYWYVAVNDLLSWHLTIARVAGFKRLRRTASHLSRARAGQRVCSLVFRLSWMHWPAILCLPRRV